MQLASIDDTALVGMAQGQNEAAFEELLARHDGRCFQTALGMLNDCYADASDAMQEARVRCWQHLSSFDAGLGKFCDWYLAIVRNCCQDIYKRNQRTADWMGLDAIEHIVASPLDLLIDLEERSFLRGAVAALPESQSVAVRLRYLDGCEYPEIARVMGVAENTVRKHVERGLNNLRERLGQVGLTRRMRGGAAQRFPMD